jgi:hypothetical protein
MKHPIKRMKRKATTGRKDFQIMCMARDLDIENMNTLQNLIQSD